MTELEQELWNWRLQRLLLHVAYVLWIPMWIELATIRGTLW